MPLKAIIFDRDGTLNQTAATEGGYVLSPNDMVLLPRVDEALQKLAMYGVDFYVFTQQSCIGKGLLHEEDLKLVHGRLNALLAPARIRRFYYCPHTEKDACNCRKPQPGLLLKCLAEQNLQPEEVLVVGDSERDFLAAQRAGLHFVWVRHNQNPAAPVSASYVVTGWPVFTSVTEWVDFYVAQHAGVQKQA